MKQIFDWLREKFKEDIEWYETHGIDKDFNRGIVGEANKGISLVDEAEAKAEAEVCELVDKLRAETSHYGHGICEIRSDEECIDFECCEDCFADAKKDALVNKDSKFRKISEVE